MIDVFFAEGEEPTRKDVYDEKSAKHYHRQKVHKLACSDFYGMDMVDDIEEAVPIVTDVRGDENSNCRGDVVKNVRAEEGLSVENVAEHIRDQADQGDGCQSLGIVASVRVVSVFKRKTHIHNEKQRKHEMQKVGNQQVTVYFITHLFISSFQNYQKTRCITLKRKNCKSV